MAKGFSAPRYTQIPDEIFDYWLSRLSGAQFKVLLYIARRTFGFRKSSDTISLNQICTGIEGLDQGTGLTRKGAIESIAELESLGLVVVNRSPQEEKLKTANEYSLNVRSFEAENSKEGVVTSGNHPSELSTPPVVTSGNPQQTVLQQTDLKTPLPPSPNGEENPEPDPESPTLHTVDISRSVAQWFRRLPGVNQMSSSARSLIEEGVGIWLDRPGDLQEAFELFEKKDFHRKYDLKRRIRTFFRFAASAYPRASKVLAQPPASQDQSPGTSARSNGTPRPERLSLRLYLGLWNGTIPERYEGYPAGDKSMPALESPEFDVAKVLARARQVIQDNGDSGTEWLDAYWPLKSERETGRFNFQKLLKPGFMRPASKARASQNQATVDAARKSILSKGVKHEHNA